MKLAEKAPAAAAVEHEQPRQEKTTLHTAPKHETRPEEHDEVARHVSTHEVAHPKTGSKEISPTKSALTQPGAASLQSRDNEGGFLGSVELAVQDLTR
jgi:hypothetical protein